MKEVRDCWCIQIDVTNACENACSNCTHMVKCANPWRMDMNAFIEAMDSLEGWHNVVGIIGGNPMLNPDVLGMIAHLCSKFPKEKRGIWISTFGKDNVYEGFIRDLFVPTNVFFNDHKKTNWHQGVMVASKDLVPDKEERDRLISNCWLANSWSPSITPKGCYRCEVMGAFDMALNLNLGLPVEKEWWKRPLSDFQHQMDAFCNRCGICVPMERRADSEQIDDVSETNLDIAVKGRSKVFDTAGFDTKVSTVDWFPSEYRNSVEKPWGITVSVGYGDCLKMVLPFNAPHFEKILVVTTSTDEKTKKVCAEYPNVQTIETDLFYRFEATFNKGAAVELATWMIPKGKWCLIFDSDTCLPQDTFLLESLNKECLYGANRVMVFEQSQFDKAIRSRNFDCEGLERATEPPFLDTIAGFFQLFHTDARSLEVRPWYGINYDNASWCDNIFTFRFATNLRRNLRITTLHLGNSQNWDGKVEGTFPRQNTFGTCIHREHAVIKAGIDAMMFEVFKELLRLRLYGSGPVGHPEGGVR